MKTILGWIILPFVIVGLFIGYVAAAFGISLAVTGVLGYFFGMPRAWAYFAIGWKVYAAFIPVTFAFLTTFDFQHCCAGLQTFRQHLRHHGWNHISNVIESVGWPVIWFILDRNFSSWGTCFVDQFINAVMYWVVDVRKGVPVTMIDESGIRTERVRSPEEGVDALVKFLKEDERS